MKEATQLGSDNWMIVKTPNGLYASYLTRLHYFEFYNMDIKQVRKYLKNVLDYSNSRAKRAIEEAACCVDRYKKVMEQIEIIHGKDSPFFFPNILDN
jgi:hypothetical protein